MQLLGEAEAYHQPAVLSVTCSTVRKVAVQSVCICAVGRLGWRLQAGQGAVVMTAEVGLGGWWAVEAALIVSFE